MEGESCHSLPSRSVLHVRGASKSLTPKPRKKKNNMLTLSKGTKKNHFVSLTFVACFYFLIVLFFFFNCLFYKMREDSVSVMYCKKLEECTDNQS